MGLAVAELLDLLRPVPGSVGAADLGTVIVWAAHGAGCLFLLVSFWIHGSCTLGGVGAGIGRSPWRCSATELSALLAATDALGLVMAELLSTRSSEACTRYGWCSGCSRHCGSFSCSRVLHSV